MNRRNFLKQSGAVAGAAMTSGLAGAALAIISAAGAAVIGPRSRRRYSL